jgi:hypothetical protein
VAKPDCDCDQYVGMGEHFCGWPSDDEISGVLVAQVAAAIRLAEAVPDLTSTAFPGPTAEDKRRLNAALVNVRAALRDFRSAGKVPVR